MLVTGGKGVVLVYFTAPALPSTHLWTTTACGLTTSPIDRGQLSNCSSPHHPHGSIPGCPWALLIFRKFLHKCAGPGHFLGLWGCRIGHYEAPTTRPVARQTCQLQVSCHHYSGGFSQAHSPLLLYIKNVWLVSRWSILLPLESCNWCFRIFTKKMYVFGLCLQTGASIHCTEPPYLTLVGQCFIA